MKVLPETLSLDMEVITNFGSHLDLHLDTGMF